MCLPSTGRSKTFFHKSQEIKEIMIYYESQELEGNQDIQQTNNLSGTGELKENLSIPLC